MAELSLNQNNLLPISLTNWLIPKKSEYSIGSKIRYHLGARLALAGASLYYLTQTICRVAIGCIAFIGSLATLGHWSQIKSFGIEQMQKGKKAGFISFRCLQSIVFLDKLPERSTISNSTAEPENSLSSFPRAASNTFENEPRLQFSDFESGNNALSQSELSRPIGSNFIFEQLGSSRPPRLLEIIEDEKAIQHKLEKQLHLAQYQSERSEGGKRFQYCSAPANFLAESHIEKILNYEVGVSHYIGRRENMEDEHLATSFNWRLENTDYPVQLFGIFDGHGGGEASEYVKNNLVNKLQETFQEYCSQKLTDKNIWNALKITFVKLHLEFKLFQPGTTATVAMILDGKLWTANVGDSRIILDDSILLEGDATPVEPRYAQLTEDAVPTDPRYRNGIIKRGGTVYNGQIYINSGMQVGFLSVARAIGDKIFPGVNPRPKITMVPLCNIPKHTHLILACDGIYEVSTTEQIAEAVRQRRESSVGELAKNIVYSAYASGSKDNLSVMVVKLK